MLLLYANTITPRLRYIVDFISSELFTDPITLTTDKQHFTSYTGPRLNYSETDFSEEEFYIKPVALLFEDTVVPQKIECFELNYAKAFFATRGDCPFDILAASFYLLSRYEEYLPHEKDAYGRYSHISSLAFREKFLHLPLVNLWLADLRNALRQKFPTLLFKHGHFKFIPSYDIDIAWSYRQKGWLRNAAGFYRSIQKGQWGQVRERWRVLTGKQKDPFDCYEWLDALHLYCKVKPVYFFLVAGEQKGYDRNIPTSSKAFRELVEYYAGVYKTGLHPSWQSSVSLAMDTLLEEKQWMEVIIDRPVQHSRQHYIKFDIPEGYRRLIAAGLFRDYSMGYGSINGFRASVASSFHWFDLDRDEPTPLRIFPYCFMEANALFEQKQNPQQAYEELVHYYNIIKKHQGLMITIWHNHLLATSPELKGWREMYEIFMKENVYWDAYS